MRCLCFCILFPYIQTLYVLFSILKAKQNKKMILGFYAFFFCPINNDNLLVIYFSNFMQKFERIYLFMRVWFILRTHTHTTSLQINTHHHQLKAYIHIFFHLSWSKNIHTYYYKKYFAWIYQWLYSWLNLLNN